MSDGGKTVVGGSNSGDQPSGHGLAQALLAHGLNAAGAYGRSLPEPLRTDWEAVYGEWLQLVGSEGPEGLFLGDSGTPALLLLAGVAETLLDDPLGPPALQAAECMITWYLAVRCQDDIVDEDAPSFRIFLEQVLSAEAQRLAVAASGAPEAMLQTWAELLIAFGAAARDDATRRTDPSEPWSLETLAAQGRKYLPMAGPLAALLHRAGRSDDIDSLRRGVERLALGLQLTNDFLGARHDLETGQRSPYLASLGLRPDLHGPDDMDPALLRGVRSGRLDRFLETVREALREGRDLLLPVAGEGIREHVAARLDALDRHRTSAGLRALVAAQPLLATVELTRRCNLRCPVCFVLAQEEEASAGAELPLPLVEEVLEELSGYATCLNLTGGEPLAYPHLHEVLRCAKALGLDDVLINTNGTLLSGDLCRELAAHGLQLRLLVSIDGPPGAHDLARGEGRCAEAIAGLRRARLHGLEASPATICTEELLDHGLGRWCAWLDEQLGAELPLVLWPLFVVPETPPKTLVGGRPVPAERQGEAARQIAAAILAGRAVSAVDQPTLNPRLQALGVPERELWQCQAGGRRLCVQADGVVSPCHALRTPLERLEPGRVSGFVARCRAHPDARRLSVRDSAGCRTCEHQRICGGCPAAVVGAGRPLFARDALCPRAELGREDGQEIRPTAGAANSRGGAPPDPARRTACPK